ncbi:MAG TPA: SUF system NifU family Fe-S cluster assembly protein [Candidatus Bilamarchaeaceae archaeon]|nr:SUF system NifU family Fe-S cluster assembly protein [Candidatus Bilamarchaeaceae archaeon]
MSSEDMYREFILELYKNPINFGKLEDADLHAESYNPLCGDKVEMYVKLTNGKVSDVKFDGSGCAISQASASLLTEEIKGKTTEQLKAMAKEDILRILQIDLSKNPSRLKCALLSLETLKKALVSP